MTDERKAPRTIADYEAQIINEMRQGHALIERLKRSGEWAKYTSQQEANPTGGPETSLGILTTPREWKAADRLVQNGVVVVTRGSLNTRDCYLIAGPNFPKAGA